MMTMMQRWRMMEEMLKINTTRQRVRITPDKG